jgi:hypothetical protein
VKIYYTYVGRSPASALDVKWLLGLRVYSYFYLSLLLTRHIHLCPSFISPAGYRHTSEAEAGGADCDLLVLSKAHMLALGPGYTTQRLICTRDDV